jgi:ribosome-binding factor A
MESKRQRQIAEIVKRNFGVILNQEGTYIYGEAFVTVTKVVVSADQGQAKIYLSIFNTENKQAVILQMEEYQHRLKQALSHRIRKHVRRIPQISFYLDETLDEMWRLNNLFDKLQDENQMGSEEE